MNIKTAWSRCKTSESPTDEEGFVEMEFGFNTGERIKAIVKLQSSDCSFWQAIPLQMSAYCITTIEVWITRTGDVYLFAHPSQFDCMMKLDETKL